MSAPCKLLTPVRAEPVEACAQGFDKLSPNGGFAIVLSSSKGKLSPNGGFPIVLSSSKDRPSPNGSFPIVLSSSKGKLSPNGGFPIVLGFSKCQPNTDDGRRGCESPSA